MKKRNRFYRLLVVLLIGAILYSGWKVLTILLEYQKGDNSYEALTEKYTDDDMFNVVDVEDNLNEDESMETAPITVSFSELLNECHDVVGWLYCEGTEINYPIVQSSDNDYYLRRLLDGTWNIAGSIFLDYRNASDFSDWNSIVYGHNMKNNSMFGSLEKYKNQEYYDKYPVWYLLTPDKDYKIELIGGYTTSTDSSLAYSIPAASEERDKLIEQVERTSTFQADVQISDQDRLITLSTCSYDFDNARYVLIGVLRELSVYAEGEK